MIKPAYSVSFLFSINIFVWQNVLYFLDTPRKYVVTLFHLEVCDGAVKRDAHSASVRQSDVLSGQSVLDCQSHISVSSEATDRLSEAACRGTA